MKKFVPKGNQIYRVPEQLWKEADGRFFVETGEDRAGMMCEALRLLQMYSRLRREDNGLHAIPHGEVPALMVPDEDGDPSIDITRFNLVRYRVRWETLWFLHPPRLVAEATGADGWRYALMEESALEHFEREQCLNGFDKREHAIWAAMYALLWTSYRVPEQLLLANREKDLGNVTLRPEFLRCIANA